jgi:hypothetical protein
MRALEGVLAEHDAITREVGVLRLLVEKTTVAAVAAGRRGILVRIEIMMTMIRGVLRRSLSWRGSRRKMKSRWRSRSRSCCWRRMGKRSGGRGGSNLVNLRRLSLRAWV